MKVSAFSPIGYSNSAQNTSCGKYKAPKTKDINHAIEPNYGKNMMQLSYIVSMATLGIFSLIMATRGKQSAHLDLKV